MRFSLLLTAIILIILVPSGFILSLPSLIMPGSAAVSIDTIIDTVGMVDDQTTISFGTGTFSNGSSLMYRDSSLSNGGEMKLTKSVDSGGKDRDSPSVSAQKVLRYDAAGTGSHLSAHEGASVRSAGQAGSDGSPACTLASGSSADTNRSHSASASLDIVGATSLQLSTSTRISPGDLQYRVSANNLPVSGNYSGPATIVSSFTYGSETPAEMARVSDRSMVSGLFDLFNRVYHATNGATIQAETRASGMVSSKTVAEHTYERVNSSRSSDGWSGSSVYAADILANGGSVDETRSLSTKSEVTSQRVVTYRANGSYAMQSEEGVTAVKAVNQGSDSINGAGCVFAGGDDSGSGSISYQSVHASSQLFGVDSSQSSSTARIDMGSRRNGTLPLTVDYRADITSPVQFDAMIVQVMTDPDKDGKYEDLNGNGRRDLQDLVLLFRNFEWLSKSSLSPRFDFNGNRRVDLADLTRAFKDTKG
jgi:hypothetical protein